MHAMQLYFMWFDYGQMCTRTADTVDDGKATQNKKEYRTTKE